VLRQLAFASDAVAGMRAADTSALISALRERHARDGVTGALLYSGDSFLQLVEGSESATAECWRALLADGHHRNPVVLHDARAPSSWFADWRAGYAPETMLAPLLLRWKALAPTLPPHEIDQLRILLSKTKTF
jgi:hypothetical protein